MAAKWSQAWLNYSEKKDKSLGKFFENISVVGFDSENKIIKNAIKEIKLGAEGYYKVTPAFCGAVKDCDEAGKGIVLLKTDVTSEYIESKKSEGITEGQIKEGYCITCSDEKIIVSAVGEAGLLFGVFRMLSLCATGEIKPGYSKLVIPDNPLRMLNHWDNMDNSIERGYSGKSFFFVDNKVVVDERTVDYARLTASVGLNAVVINNVNVKQEASYLITDKHFDKIAQMAEIFAEYGIKFYMSLNYASTIEIGGMDSADPFDEDVKKWWEAKMAEVFAKIPNLGGFLVKADSEGRPGPFTYGRTQADGANMLADIVKKYNALIIWRCFVYNCKQDWRDRKTDRARAGYDNFIEMDGDYHDNVILQIKNGPIDFQIREPISPLLGGLEKTNQMLEVQIAQEYTGQQIDVCYLIPMFKEVLDFKTYCKPEKDTVADIISGRTFKNANAGIAAVANTGNDYNWTGNTLAQANYYGFGRLAFSMDLSAEEIAREWIMMAVSDDEEIVQKILSILLPSRETYEKYVCPLGVGFMVNPSYHYGPNVDGYEYDRWGTYHRADHLGIGVDRSSKGTGYAQQYREPNASMYENIDTCPENLLLFFHYAPYSRVLSGGETLIQHIYDTHFEGVEDVEKMIATWKSLEGKIDKDIYENVDERFDRQLTNAKNWRDQINTYFYRKSGIEDVKGRTIY